MRDYSVQPTSDALALSNDVNQQLAELSVAMLSLGKFEVQTARASIANALIRVSHSFGEIPNIVLSAPSGSGAHIYYTEADEGLWTSDEIYVRCAVADALLRLLIVRL